MVKAAKAEKETPKTDLVLATEIQPAVLFGNDHETLETLLQKIKKEVSTIVSDVTTAKGRKEITANVSRVTKSKTLLDKVGKEYNAAQKELLKTFDSRRKHAFTFLEDLQKEVRQPLTDWEDKEKDRIAKCEDVINAFIQAGEDSENWMNYSVEELEALFRTVEGIKITARLQEFYSEAQKSKNNAIKNINVAINSRVKYDEDQEELKKLRESAAAQDKINYEADQREEAERNAQQKIINANNEKEAALRREEQAKEQAKIDSENAEKQRVIDSENAEKQRLIDAEAAEEKRLKDVETAAQAERDRIEAEKQADIEAERKRAANKSHNGKINRAIVKALIDDSMTYDTDENVLTENQVKRIVTLIANNKVPRVKISY